MIRSAMIAACAGMVAACVLAALPTRAGEIIYPTAGGTLADGGAFGGYDGVPDSWNWAFEPAGFAGAASEIRTMETLRGSMATSGTTWHL